MKKTTLTLLFLISVLNLFSQTKTEIKREELPQTVIRDLVENYSKYEVDKIIKKSKNNRITYEIEAKKKKTLLILIYYEKGNFLEKIKSKQITYENSLNDLPKDDNNSNSSPQQPPTPPF